MTAVILLVIASAQMFGWILAAEQKPQMAVAGITIATQGTTVALLFMMLNLLMLGTFMESLAIILILAPVFLPICANTPSLGINLMAAFRVGQIPVSAVFRYPSPFPGVMVRILLLRKLFPALITDLPALLF